MRPVAAILGPTASGKSEVALAIAERWDGEIVSVDSMQVYRGMDVGTAKPSVAQRRRVRHHMVDLVGPEHDFTVAEFQSRGRDALDAIARRDAPAVIAGGSGLHFRSLVDPLDFPATDPAVRTRLEALPVEEARTRLLAADPAAEDLVDMANPRRVVRALEVYELTGTTPSDRAAHPAAERVRRYESDLPLRAIGFDPGDALPARVTARVDTMWERGLVAEVAGLRTHLGQTARQAVGYKEILPYLDGTITQEAAKDHVIRNTLALAKRQRTYFGRDPRIRWLAWSDDPAVRVAAAVAALQEVAAWSS